MSVWRPRFIKCIILDHKLQRMLNDSKIAQLNSERPLHQTAVIIKVLIRIESNCQINSDMSRDREKKIWGIDL